MYLKIGGLRGHSHEVCITESEIDSLPLGLQTDLIGVILFIFENMKRIPFESTKETN